MNKRVRLIAVVGTSFGAIVYLVSRDVWVAAYATIWAALAVPAISGLSSVGESQRSNTEGEVMVSPAGTDEHKDHGESHGSTETHQGAGDGESPASMVGSSSKTQQMTTARTDTVQRRSGSSEADAGDNTTEFAANGGSMESITSRLSSYTKLVNLLVSFGAALATVAAIGLAVLDFAWRLLPAPAPEYVMVTASAGWVMTDYVLDDSSEYQISASGWVNTSLVAQFDCAVADSESTLTWTDARGRSRRNRESSMEWMTESAGVGELIIACTSDPVGAYEQPQRGTIARMVGYGDLRDYFDGRFDNASGDDCRLALAVNDAVARNPENGEQTDGSSDALAEDSITSSWAAGTLSEIRRTLATSRCRETGATERTGGIYYQDNLGAFLVEVRRERTRPTQWLCNRFGLCGGR